MAKGVTIAPGTYRFTRFRVEAEFAARRPLSGQLTWWFGGFYGGHLNQFQIEAAWRPSAAFAIEIEGERDIGTLPVGRIRTTLVGARLRFNVSPDLQVNSFVQYDTESASIGSNSRLRWTITPVAELYLIYNHNLRDQINRFRFESNQLSAKLAYAWRR